MCERLVSVKGFYSIENPAGSYIFKYSPVLQLSKLSDSWLINFAQCVYGLQLPGASAHAYCRKNNSLLTNMIALRVLAAKCPGISKFHRHEIAWGSKKVNGKVVKLAASAGKYPVSLCEHWAQAVKLAYDQSLV